MDSPKASADVVEGNRVQIQDGAEIISSAVSEVGLNVDRRPSVSILQVPGMKPSTSSSNLPPLSATKSGKNSGAHGQGPRPHLRSRASLEKNKINISLTGIQGMPPTLPGILPTPLTDKRTSSLPMSRTNANSSGRNCDFVTGQSHELTINVPGYEKVNPIIRSFSTPVIGDKVESFRRDGKGFVLLRTVSPRPSSVHLSRENELGDAIYLRTTAELDVEKGKVSTKDEVEEAIPEEEAVCRICMDSLSEDIGETLKMECRCRGEMALAHKDCAFKWFGIKGDRVCEVCGAVVQNIPVTVVRFLVQEEMMNHTRSIDAQISNRASVWQDILIMAILNMVAYFCFIEQLLVNKLGTKALAISIPFSIIIGLLASVTTVALVTKRYIWLYACIQFALVCMFGYLFFYKTQLETVLAVLLAAFSGFGVAMTSNALILEYMHWKTYSARRAQSAVSVVDVEVSFRQDTSGDLGVYSQWSRELNVSQVSSAFDIVSESNSSTRSGRSQAPSDAHSVQCS